MQQIWTVVTIHFVQAANLPEAKGKAAKTMADWCTGRPATKTDLQMMNEMRMGPEKRRLDVIKFIIKLKS